MSIKIDHETHRPDIVSAKINECSMCSTIQVNVNGEVIYDKSVKLKDDRIAALENLVNYLLPKAEYGNDGYCPECDAYHLQPHGADCEFIKATAVLEGK